MTHINLNSLLEDESKKMRQKFSRCLNIMSKSRIKYAGVLCYQKELTWLEKKKSLIRNRTDAHIW